MIGSMSLTALADKLDGQVIGSDAEFGRLSTDTRAIQKGDAYLALVGERFDGNEFVDEAVAKGASAAIVSRDIEHDKIALLKVADTHAALGAIAHENRLRSQATTIALTGSQGKTTVKEMLACILKHTGKTLSTDANLNNTIGVPLTLLRLEQDHEFAVVEMGANCKGEIAFSVGVASPNIVLITNASAAHIEGFGSLQGIVEAKGEILDGLQPGGTALLNADDPNVEQWMRRATEKRIVQFGVTTVGPQVAYRANDIQIGQRGQVSFTLESPDGNADIQLQLLGAHNVKNAVAAAATAMEAGASLDDVKKGLSELAPVKGRMSILSGLNGCCLIDDTYNASPSSFMAAIDVLNSFSERKFLIAGDIKELGEESVSAHESVGHYAANSDIDELWGVGEFTRYTVAAYGDRGRYFENQEELIAACQAQAGNDIAFLVKGSRGAQMDLVIKAMQNAGEQ